MEAANQFQCDNDWQNGYQNMVQTAEDAVAYVRPGQRIFVGSGCGQPQSLVRALVQRAYDLEGSEIVHLLSLSDLSGDPINLEDHFRVNSFFIAGDMNTHDNKGLGDYTPIYISEIPQLFNSGQLPLDVALVQVSVPDKNGMCSLGISVDIVKSAIENACLVIAQVNRHMPRTQGDSLIYIHDMDILVSADEPLLESKLPEPTETSIQIAEYVAALIENGATLGLSIGRIPMTVLKLLKEKSDLGIHTEVISDEFIELIESGVLTGIRKNIDQNKIVAGSCMGTSKIYEYVHNNPAFSFHPTEYVSDPFLISKQQQMISINEALEVDLAGQVCANSLGSGFFLGLGNHMDFMRGAARSPRGKTIVTLDATRDNGNISRIVTHLSPGSGVTATSFDVHYVVTEYGVAYLHGKSLQERALALISVADPKFRGELIRQAVQDNYIASEMQTMEGKIMVGPRELRTTLLLDSGIQINFRPMHPTDEKVTNTLFHSLSKETLYYRFMTNIARIPQQQIQDFVYVDYRADMAIVGTVPESHGEEIVAVGRYYLNPRTNRAEVAFTVHDGWQKQGIGTFLLKYLVNIAKRNGISGFTAEVLRDNSPMIGILHKSGCKVRSRLEDGVHSFELDFE